MVRAKSENIRFVIQIKITKMDPRVLNVGCCCCPGWDLGTITARLDDHLGSPGRRAHAHIAHAFLLPDWLIRSAAPLAEKVIGLTPTPPSRLGVSFHRRSVSALFTLTDRREPWRPRVLINGRGATVCVRKPSRPGRCSAAVRRRRASTLIMSHILSDGIICIFFCNNNQQ